MALFLVDKDVEITYEELCNEINLIANKRLLRKKSRLYALFETLIIDKLNGSNIVLSEDIYDRAPVDLKPNLRISCPEEITEKILNSKSYISLLTSGTAGIPKSVTHTISNLIRNIRISEKYREDIWAFAYNPMHMAGSQVFFQALLNLNPLINTFSFNRDDIFKIINKYKITHISATPTFYRMLMPADTALPTVKRVSLGGEKSDDKLHNELKMLFPSAKINNIYASTEAGALFSSDKDLFTIPDDLKNFVKIIDGELNIHSSLIGNSDSFELYGGYYKTGDIIKWIDESKGIFKISHRVNDMINVGGYKVNPREIEETIMRIDGVVNVIVFGKPNSVIGNILCAEIVPLENAVLNENIIRGVLRIELEEHKIPRIIHILDKLSLTKTGKTKLK